jgi:hypothetical protein
MRGSLDVSGRGKTVVTASLVEADGLSGSQSSSHPRTAVVLKSEDHVSEMMGRLRLTAAEAVAVMLEDDADEIPVHSKWAIIGKRLSPAILHISTITSAL